MFKKTRKAIRDFATAHLANQQAILASQCEIISELRHHSVLLERRDETLTEHLSFLARDAADKRLRSGHPTI